MNCKEHLLTNSTVLLRETARGVPPRRNLSNHNLSQGGTPSCPFRGWGFPCLGWGYPILSCPGWRGTLSCPCWRGTPSCPGWNGTPSCPGQGGIPSYSGPGGIPSCPGVPPAWDWGTSTGRDLGPVIGVPHPRKD